MSDAVVLVLLLAGIPLGLAVFCGIAQGMLTCWLKNEILRAVLVAVLPGVTGITALYVLFRLLNATGWDNIGWGIYLLWAGGALVGTLLGWLIGALSGRKRQK